jgi:hypothetical protein
MCRCICGGRNHGILRYRNPVINVTGKTHDQKFAEWMKRFEEPEQIAPFLPLLPNIQPKTQIDPETRRPSLRPPRPQGHSLTRKIGRSLKHSLVGYSQNELNENVLKGLRYQFMRDRVDAIIEQAFTIFFSRNSDANRPELYELYENGDIDRALELFNVRWVVGRPKIRK